MKCLLKITGLLEAGAGLGLLAVPAFVVRLLLGAEISGAAVPLGRVGGAGLLALGIACWLAQYDDRSCAARAVISGMVFYNFGAAAVLGIAGVQAQPTGILLWPAVILHTGMGIWCIASLLKKP
ncbi:MAG: hypothetical protein V4689_21895 [Verrucomicrobiota bacterium]